MLKINRALISVSEKTGIVEFAKELRNFDIELISTGGTYKLLTDAKIPVIKVDEITGFPEMLDGRVKTLHPKIHAGILALRTEEHLNQIRAHGIKPIDMVVVNLYPFELTISKEKVELSEAIENIDIGGPSMIRAAAKNYQNVAVVVNPERYPEVIAELNSKGGLEMKTLENLAVEAFQHTAEYDSVVYNYLQHKFNPEVQFPNTLLLRYKKVSDLRYGENAHQKAAFYRETKFTEPSVTSAKQLHGKELSFNNILDINEAFELVKEFEEPTAVIIKHTNPCGLASNNNLYEAYKRAYQADPLSAFGGVVGLNRRVDAPIAEEISKTFLEAVIAPDYGEKALEILKKKKNIRILETGDLTDFNRSGVDLKKVVGGLLIQDRDIKELNPNDLKVVTKRAPTKEELESLLYAFKVVRHVKSNAIIFVKGKETVGVGAGQMSRVVAVKIATEKAGEKARGAVMASDAFFPFRDGIDVAGKAGITAVIQPGGSIRDEEAIAAANEYNMAMVFTGMRAFKH